MNYEKDVLNPLEGLGYYLNAFMVALDNNDNVIDYIQYHSPKTHFDILVKNSTENIENEVYQFDMSHFYNVTNIEKTETNQESELAKNYDEGLLISIDIINPNKKWCPIHPFEVCESEEYNSIYDALSSLFGGEKEDYMFKDTDWVEKSIKHYNN